METTRRSFLQMFGLGATAVAAGIVVPEIFMPEEKVVRTYFDMGRNREKQILTGLYPIEGLVLSYVLGGTIEEDSINGL